MIKFLIQLLVWSVAISSLLKYLAPALVDLGTLPPLRMQAIAICVVSLPVVFYGLIIWAKPRT
ncbi:MAG: hypothetical protein SFT94_03290 [Pseudanabaenaceae cyanobacterium bins.68]|nr:hypothetical protein [Pseudanabaenaceae cyanobacterium bins.68]